MLLPWYSFIKGNDHEPDMDGDTMTGLTDAPKMLSNTLAIKSALLHPLQFGVFP